MIPFIGKSRVGKSIEIESQSAVACGWRGEMEAVGRGMTAKGTGFFSRRSKYFQSDLGAACRYLWIH